MYIQRKPFSILRVKSAGRSRLALALLSKELWVLRNACMPARLTAAEPTPALVLLVV